MATHTVVKFYNAIGVEFEQVNGQLMANATSMCAVFGKVPKNWRELESTKRYIDALEKKQLAFWTLIETRVGATGGTWIHEKLILNLAQWLDADFAVQCDEWVAELLRTGSVALPQPDRKRTPLSLIIEMAQEMEAIEARLENHIDKAVKQLDATTTERIDELLHTVANQAHDLTYFTVAGYYALRGVRSPSETALASLGKAASQLSRALSIPIDKTKHVKYGSVNVYRDDILAQTLGF